MEKTPDRLSSEIWKTINYFRYEYEIKYAEAIGVLELIKQQLIDELFEQEAEDFE